METSGSFNPISQAPFDDITVTRVVEKAYLNEVTTKIRVNIVRQYHLCSLRKYCICPSVTPTNN